jgi:ubiquinone/menaquinone biosynthesis C-methylase UbiE
MDRTAWLKEQRRLSEEQEDNIYSSIYDENWGAVEPTHQRFFASFLELCPPHGQVLDAACGTGKYWPLILASGRTVFGIDQSQGMLSRAQEKHPAVAVEKGGLQEMSYRAAFDAAVCMDALEGFPPEDWPLVLRNIHRALKSGGFFYFTVEVTTQEEIEKAFKDAQAAGLPVVYGEWAYEDGYHGDWAQTGAYHYYPTIDQVKEWVQGAGFHLIAETEGDQYHHFLVQRH